MKDYQRVIPVMRFLDALHYVVTITGGEEVERQLCNNVGERSSLDELLQLLTSTTYTRFELG